MSCKNAKRIDKHEDVLFEAWEFCCFECMIRAVVKEAIVCGDTIRQDEHTVIIHNFHKGGTRWRGSVKQ